MKGSRVKNSNNFTNASVNISAVKAGKNYKSQNILPNQPPKIEDEMISNLQKQIYYLELEMKLMKDKEIDTKNKVGGYEVLFRDGVPLNEHFLALKTKYKNERDHCENQISDVSSEIQNIEDENRYLQSQIEETNKNYYKFIEKFSNDSDYFQSKIFDLNSKLIHETNSKESLIKDKDILDKSLYKFNSENVHHNRTLEKNKLFKENIEEKNNNIKQRNLDKFNEIDKLLVRSLLELESIELKLQNNTKGKQIENENSVLLMTISKLERELHLAKAKVTEFENIQILNKKYLLDEELTKKIHERENRKLNEELDGMSKLNEETVKQKVKENEKNKSIVIKNSIASNESKMRNLLELFKKEEANARDLLDEKNILSQRIVVLREDIDNQKSKEGELKQEKIEVKNIINQLEFWVEENKSQVSVLTVENERFKENSDRNEIEIQQIQKKLEEIQQRVELNSILKDIDINELKMLSQNNALVNSSINTIMTKWDKVHSKLQEIETKEKREI